MRTKEIHIGNIVIGGKNKIAIQTMVNTDTNNVNKTVEQSINAFNASAELVRITVPTNKEIRKIKEIKEILVSKNYKNPIIADIHYKPNIALKVAKYIDKIRINPGNYIEKNNISDSEAKEKLEQNLLPLITECKKYNTAIRLGANYGSLSNRVLQKYGNTALGMYKSVEDFLSICQKHSFENIVLSMKASDPRIMVQACRLLQSKMQKTKPIFPQHLGVTEAGSGNEARIKSSIGMATLLSEGIGETLRVSLTESPLAELPVAQNIVKYFSHKNQKQLINFEKIKNLRRNYSLNDKYIIISDFIEDITNLTIKPDFIFTTKKTNLNNTQDYICNSNIWENENNIFPIFSANNYLKSTTKSNKYNFIHDKISNFTNEIINKIENDKTSIIIINTNNYKNIFTLRNNYNNFITNIKNTPIIINRQYKNSYSEFIIQSSGETGSILLDKLSGGIWLQNSQLSTEYVIETGFTILQATKLRISKTEYISCPTCGRTKFNIEKITEQVKNKTANFKGITIAIMGCIVNGPGEMADADYGYVGAGNNLVHLYKKGKLIKKNIKQNDAINELLILINNSKE